jgi:hypothetical protein
MLSSASKIECSRRSLMAVSRQLRWLMRQEYVLSGHFFRVVALISGKPLKAVGEK